MSEIALLRLYDTADRLHGMIAERADSDDPLIRHQMRDLRCALDALEDNIASPVLDEDKKQVTQDEYNALSTRFANMCDNVRALVEAMARHANRGEHEGQAAVEFLACEQSIDDMEKFAAKYLNPESDTPPDMPKPAQFDVFYFECKRSRDGKYVLAKFDGVTSRLKASQGVKSICDKLTRRLPRRSFSDKPRKVELVNQDGTPFTI